MELNDQLKIAQKEKALPKVIAYNRIDGPGSSLDLSEFQQTFWRLPQIPKEDDPARKWTSNLPRTVGITINTGTQIEAHPFDPDLIGVKSIEYETEVIARPGEVLPIKENWLL
ncbi:MAG: GHMP kinase, partial [Methanobacterium sp.]